MAMYDGASWYKGGGIFKGAPRSLRSIGFFPISVAFGFGRLHVCSIS